MQAITIYNLSLVGKLKVEICKQEIRLNKFKLPWIFIHVYQPLLFFFIGVCTREPPFYIVTEFMSPWLLMQAITIYNLSLVGKLKVEICKQEIRLILYVKKNSGQIRPAML
jgi:hypothetical protein